MISAFVPYGDDLGYADLHLPSGEGTTGFLDPLEDPIDIVHVLPDEPTDPKIVLDDLII